MKKLSLYVFLGLLWCNVGFAENVKDLFNKEKEGVSYEELQKQKRKQAEFRCAHLSGKSQNEWSAKKIYKTCLAKDGY